MSSASDPIKPHKSVSLEERSNLVRIDCNAPNQELVRDLEILLERARSGDIRAIAYAYQVGSQGVGRGAHLGTGSAVHLNFALDWLKDHLLHYDD